jgi:hypothetical protein
LIFDLIVFDHGGWKLDVGNWERSLFSVFVMSILFGYVNYFLISMCCEFYWLMVANAYRSSFIAEFLFSVREHKDSTGRNCADLMVNLTMDKTTSWLIASIYFIERD